MRLLFEVEDTGTGIAPEELTLLFNAFAQTAGGRAAGQRWKARVWAWRFITVSRNYWAAKSTLNLRWSKARYSNFDPRDLRRSDVSPAKAICPAPYRLVPQPTDFPHPGRRGQVGTPQTTGLFIGALGFRGPRDAKRTRGRGSLNRASCRLRRVYPQTSPRRINL